MKKFLIDVICGYSTFWPENECELAANEAEPENQAGP